LYPPIRWHNGSFSALGWNKPFQLNLLLLIT